MHTRTQGPCLFTVRLGSDPCPFTVEPGLLNLTLSVLPSKPFFFSSLSSSEIRTCHYTAESHSLPADIENRALYLLNFCNSPNHLFRVHALLVTSGLFQNPSFSGRLLKLASNQIDDSCYALSIFKSIDFPDAFCVNTVIKKYSCDNYHEKAVAFYAEMLRDGSFYPNGFTFPPLISACSKLGSLSLGRMCHGHALKFGVDKILPVENSLVYFYASCRLMDVACNVFDEMQSKDLVSWNTLIDGYAKGGEMGLAHKLFDSMLERNVVSWNIMMTGYLNFYNPGNVLKLFRQMMVRGFKSDDSTLVSVITACGRSCRLKEGRSVHGFLVKSFHRSSLTIDTAMVDMYCKCRRVDIAQAIFYRMPSKNLVAWNAMILGHCIHGNPVFGLGLYSKIAGRIRQNDESAKTLDYVDEGNRIFPDEVTFIGVLCACYRMEMLTEGRNYFSQMIDEFHVKPNFAHYWCMANLMAKVGLMQEAVAILKNIPFDDNSSPEYLFWAGFFGSCRLQGNVTLGEQIAKGLIEQDPMNFSHYNLLVNIYAAAGRWEEVARTKDMMKEIGIRRVPCSTLKDLKKIVCSVQVGGARLEGLPVTLDWTAGTDCSLLNTY